MEIRKRNYLKLYCYPMSIKNTRAFLKRSGENSSYRSAVKHKKMMSRYVLRNLYRVSIRSEKIFIERELRK